MPGIISALFFMLTSAVFADGIDLKASEIWSITPTEKTERRIVIHNPEEARKSGIFHIEVLGRDRGDAVWQVRRLAPHMAITKAALERSVVAPLERGAVYPEAYDDAYAGWRRENGGRGGAVCRSSVSECLPK